MEAKSPKSPKPLLQVAAALIWRDGKLLITSRPKGRHLAGFWEFPGGKQEEDETLRRCLEREIKEELGVEIRAGKRLVSMGPKAGASELRDPQFMCIDDANNVYVLDRRLRSVIIYNPVGEYISSFAYGESPRDPRGLAVDSTGAVYIADRRNHTVVRFK